jgi:hypothetical protein
MLRLANPDVPKADSRRKQAEQVDMISKPSDELD